jgi:hypothetical protein
MNSLFLKINFLTKINNKKFAQGNVNALLGGKSANDTNIFNLIGLKYTK